MVFLDANIILELILERQKFQAVENIIRATDDHAISMLTVHLIMYFGIKNGVNAETLYGFIGGYKVLDISQSDYRWAKKYCHGSDFEDALQVACAVRSGAKQFITLDKTLANLYKKSIPMLTV